MKKILVVLLILAVAGGVFAQGTWSIGAEAEIGSRVNFDPRDKSFDAASYDATDPTTWGGYNEQILDADGNPIPARVIQTGYNDPYGWLATSYGQLTIGYEQGPVSVSNNFYISDDGENSWFTSLAVVGDNYSFNVKAAPRHFLGLGPGFWDGMREMYGDYTLLNGMVYMKAAFYSNETEYWISDKTGAIDGDITNKNSWFGGYVGFYGHTSGLFADGSTFTFVERPMNYFLTSLGIGSIDFGLMIPNVFGSDVEFIDDALKATIFGVMFDMDPIEFAGQFKFANYGIYLGVRYFTGPITLGLSFMGTMKPDYMPVLIQDADAVYKLGIIVDTSIEDTDGTRVYDNASTMKGGLSINYDADAFGAGLKGWYRADTLSSEYNVRYIGVEPNFFYNAIPSHLSFRLDGGFYFVNVFADDEAKAQDIIWAIQPQIFWNFRGTGASPAYAWGGTQFIARYRAVKDSINALDIVFKWGI